MSALVLETEDMSFTSNIKLRPALTKDNDLARVVQRLDNTIHRIDHYPVDKC